MWMCRRTVKNKNTMVLKMKIETSVIVYEWISISRAVSDRYSVGIFVKYEYEIVELLEVYSLD